MSDAIWIDLIAPGDVEMARLPDPGAEVPTLAQMGEIEIANPRYREGGKDYMTVVLTGERGILGCGTPARLLGEVTVSVS